MSDANDKMFAELKREITNRAIAALKPAVREFNRLTDPQTPIDTGTLQRSKKERVEGSDVYAVMGNDKTQGYLHRQVYESLRHMGSLETGLESLRARYSDAGGGIRRTGRGRRYLYGRAYRLALKQNTIRKLPAPMPYERGAADPQIMNAVAEVFVRRF